MNDDKEKGSLSKVSIPVFKHEPLDRGFRRIGEMGISLSKRSISDRGDMNCFALI